MINLNSKTAEETLALVATRQIDWEMMRKMAQMSLGERMMYVLRDSAEIKTEIKEEFRELYPDLSESELNMEVLRHLTPVLM